MGLRTPLYDSHLAAGARMVNVAADAVVTYPNVIAAASTQ